MTTPRVTVPVEPTGVSPIYTAAYDSIRKGAPGLSDATCQVIARSINMKLTAAPVREEGGAGETAVKIATDLHHAYEQLIYGLPKYLEAENLTDEENMIREAWITLDVTAHRLAALATREEAPAEAGEDELNAIARIIFPENERVKMDREWGGNRSHSRDRWNKALGQATEILALRAQPPAREDAQPVAWLVTNKATGHEHLLWQPLADLPFNRERFSTAPLYTRPSPPAPDAEKLRIAVEALTRTRRLVAEASESGFSDPDTVRALFVNNGAITQALAALQAEQKGGA